LKLVIVESPAKAKTISKFLGSDYEVVASYGHIRDLPSSAAEVPEAIKQKPWSRMAVDIDNNFEPYYVIPSGTKKRINALKKLMKKADTVVLATDEDREGEAISWHLMEVLQPKVPVERIVFHEITKSAIDEAIANPRQVDDKLVRAQESRRILDRLYGYSLSPVLWKKVRRNLSAGRVQSVAVRLVVEREEARRAFVSAEYWNMEATLSAEGIDFQAGVTTLGGKRLASGKDFDAKTGQLKNDQVMTLLGPQAQQLAKDLQDNTPWKVVAVDQKQTRLRPAPPLITSSLQQAASSLLGISPSQTMRIAQRLYEGVDFGGDDREGLITYMRTDSLTLSDRAMAEAGEVITAQFGKRYYEGPRAYKSKSKAAQEAHEAIRPTHLSRTPEKVAPYVSNEDLSLYRLIWNRTMASQMADAELLKTAVDFQVGTSQGEAILRSNGSVVSFPGHLAVADSAQKDNVLPAIQQGQGVGPGEAIALKQLDPICRETKPPGRYTEASLVKRLEEEGIGRPSTYAPTITVVQNRGYVDKRGNALVPTFLGIAVTRLLRNHFSEYVDLQFTARMEDALDDIADGEENWVKFLSAFFHGKGNFGPGLDSKIAAELPGIPFSTIEVGDDPESGEPIIVRLGKTAPFYQRGEGGPGNTASVPLALTYDELSLEDALKAIEARAKGDQVIGVDPESGKEVFVLEGPYGPYVQLGKMEIPEAVPGKKAKKPKKPKRASLPPDMTAEQVTLEWALKHLSLPRSLGSHPESGKTVSAAIGRFGPYIKCENDFRSLKAKDGDDPFTVTFERALELLAQPKVGRGGKKLLRDLGEDKDSKATIQLYDGRYGPYVTDGKINASLPKDAKHEEITLDAALILLANSPKAKAKAAPKKKAASKKKAAAKKKTAARKKTAVKKKA
jgi:DNA topoisomerase-1